MQIFRNKEKIGVLSKSGTNTLELSATEIVFGARQYSFDSLTLDVTTTGVGGVELGKSALTFYYVYLVESNQDVYLIASTSNQRPTGFSKYKKVGAFYTSGSNNLFKVYRFGQVPRETESALLDGLSANTTAAVIPIFESSSNFVDPVNSSRGSTVGEYNVRFLSNVFAERPGYTVIVADNSNGFNNTVTGIAEDIGDANNSIMPDVFPGVRIRLGTHTNSTIHQWFTLKCTYQGIDAIKPDWTDY